MTVDEKWYEQFEGLEFGDMKTVAMAKLPPDEMLDGEPTPALVESIRKAGIIEPVILVAGENGSSDRVIEGRRRIKAARENGLPSVPARYLKSVTSHDVETYLALDLHSNRSANAVTEFKAVDALLTAGLDEKQISDLTGMAIGRVKRMETYYKLIPELHDAFINEQIGVSIAHRATRLSETQQRNLLAVYEEKGKLTGRDVRNARTIDSQAAIDALDLGFGSDDEVVAIPSEIQQGQSADVVEALKTLVDHIQKSRSKKRPDQWDQIVALVESIG